MVGGLPTIKMCGHIRPPIRCTPINPSKFMQSIINVFVKKPLDVFINRPFLSIHSPSLIGWLASFLDQTCATRWVLNAFPNAVPIADLAAHGDAGAHQGEAGNHRHCFLLFSVPQDLLAFVCQKLWCTLQRMMKER